MRTFPLLFIVLFSGSLQAGVIDTVAGDGSPQVCGQPFGLEVGPDGALYICEVQNHRVLRFDRKTGKLTTIAGTGKKGYSGDGGPATQATLNEPYEIRFDKAGHIYFVEMQNHIVRRIDAKTGEITSIAGTGKSGFGGDGGPAGKAQLSSPHSIALDESRGHLYIADIGNHRIRRVDLKAGTIDTITGNGEKKPPVAGAAQGKPMIGPRALFVANDTLYIALREGHSVWTMSLKTGDLKHVSGTGKAGFGGDGKPAAGALFNGPKGICVDAVGSIYIVDTENQAIRMIDGKTGILSTIAGAPGSGEPVAKSRGYSGDGGEATKAKMDRPHGICVDKDGTVYIGDSNNHRVRGVRGE